MSVTGNESKNRTRPRVIDVTVFIMEMVDRNRMMTTPRESVQNLVKTETDNKILK